MSFHILRSTHASFVQINEMIQFAAMLFDCASTVMIVIICWKLTSGRHTLFATIFFTSKNQTSAKTPVITAYNGNNGNTTKTTELSAGSSWVVTQHGTKPVAEISDRDIIEQAEDHNDYEL